MEFLDEMPNDPGTGRITMPNGQIFETRYCKYSKCRRPFQVDITNRNKVKQVFCNTPKDEVWTRCRLRHNDQVGRLKNNAHKRLRRKQARLERMEVDE